MHTKVFSALRHRGFRESEVNAVLSELRANPVLADATAERLLAKRSAEQTTCEEIESARHGA